MHHAKLGIDVILADLAWQFPWQFPWFGRFCAYEQNIWCVLTLLLPHAPGLAVHSSTYLVQTPQCKSIVINTVAQDRVQ